jgi:hypothetical protein
MNEIEMRPHWLPDGSKNVCDSDGKIILINLEKMEIIPMINRLKPG